MPLPLCYSLPPPPLSYPSPMIAFAWVPAKNTRIDSGNHKGEVLGSLPDGCLRWIDEDVQQAPISANLAEKVLGGRSWLGTNPLKTDELEEKTSVRRKSSKGRKFANVKEKVERLKEALDRLDNLPTHPDCDAYASLLRQCADAKALSEGKRLHAHVLRSGYGDDRFLMNLLVHMYGNCGSLTDARAVFDGIRRPNLFSWRIVLTAYAHNGHLEDARSVFDKMPRRDVFSWTAMIVAYAQNERGKEVLQLFRRMDLEGVKPDKITYINVLHACSTLALGKRIHDIVADNGLESDVIVGTALVKMYGKYGSLDDARRVFDKCFKPDVVSWTVMIAAYVQNGYRKEALELYKRMDREGLKPDKVTFISVLGACASLAGLREGKEIHASIVDCGFELDVVVGNAIINMYGKCGCSDGARVMFEKMPKRDVVSWTAMITAYAQNGRGKDALELFRQMGLAGVNPNKITLISVLDACTSLAALTQGKMAHASIVDGGFESDMVVGNALINMYNKCGNLDDARSVFDKMPQRDVVSWTAMITAYSQNGCAKEALDVFQQMDMEGVKADKITLTSVLDACASLAALEQGKRIHASIIDGGIELDVFLGNALVNMYGKCGISDDARSVFDGMPEQNVVSWTTMIAAYAQNGHAKEALELFQQMDLEGAKPNNITFICILFACSHAGLLDDGWMYLVSMSRDHGIMPGGEHYGCMLDLIGRAGQLDEAEDLISNMPFEPDTVAWMSLLGACRIHSDVERGVHTARHIFKLDPKNPSPYVLLSNIYAGAGRQDDVAMVRLAMEERGVETYSGNSCIEVKNKVHIFVVGDTAHPQKEEIYVELQKLSSQMMEAGYMPDTNVVLHDVEDEEKEHLLGYHSEKLAIAFGLVSTPAGTPLHIIKNLHMCSDCHAGTKFISEIVGRKIIVRDANRFHRFEHGVCSCGDYL